MKNKEFISVRFSKSKLGRRNRELAFLHDLGSDLTSSLDLQDVLQRAAKKVSKHYKVAVVRVYLLNEPERCLELVAFTGVSDDEVEPLRRIALSEGFSGKAVRTRSFVAQKITDLEDEARTAVLKARGFKVIICVPMIIREEVLGVVNLASRRAVSITETDVDLFLAVGNQIAIGVNAAKLYEDLRRKADEIQKKRDELEFFAYTISHDLKSPSVGIVGLIRSMMEKYGDTMHAEVRSRCQTIRKAAEHISKLVTDINEYITASKAAFKIEKVDIKRIIHHIHEEVADVLEQRNITWSEPSATPEIVVDELAVTRVFRNIISNALKHGGEELTKITIGFAETDRTYVFSFNNDGTTIGRQDSEAIFQVFRRLPASRQIEGSGLGLAIVRDIVEGWGGKVWVESNLSAGTTFYVSIPRNA